MCLWYGRVPLQYCRNWPNTGNQLYLVEKQNRLHKVRMEGTHLKIIKASYDKATANIPLKEVKGLAQGREESQAAYS